MKINIETCIETYSDRGENWDSDAACGELLRGDPETFDEYFYPDYPNRAVNKMAKKICAACPVRVECLDDALAHNDGFGIKAGLTPRERTVRLKEPDAS